MIRGRHQHLSGHARQEVRLRIAVDGAVRIAVMLPLAGDKSESSSVPGKVDAAQLGITKSKQLDFVPFLPQ
jgi:hypothetical protein